MGEFIVEPNNSGVLDESVSSGNLVTSQYRRKLHFMKRKFLYLGLLAIFHEFLQIFNCFSEDYVLFLHGKHDFSTTSPKRWVFEYCLGHIMKWHCYFCWKIGGKSSSKLKSSLWVNARCFKGVSQEVSRGFWNLSCFSIMWEKEECACLWNFCPSPIN